MLFSFKKDLKFSQRSPKRLCVPVIRINKANSIGNVWTQTSVEHMMKEFDRNGRKIYGCVIDQDYEVSLVRDLKKTTHFAYNLYIEDDFLVSEVEFLNSEKANMAYESLVRGLTILRPTISGFIQDENKEIVVHELVSFDILEANEGIARTVEWVEIK